MMDRADDIKFHCDRAMAELDLARRTDSVPAARAHLALSELHLDRMRALGVEESPAPLQAVS